MGLSLSFVLIGVLIGLNSAWRAEDRRREAEEW